MDKEEITREKVGKFYSSSYKYSKEGYSHLTKGSKKHLNELEKKIHNDLNAKNFGCGCTIPTNEITGSTCLDLGSGSGRDCFILSGLVGDSGQVIGVDMLDDAINFANKYKEHHKKAYGLSKDVVDFRKGEIENLKKSGIKDGSIDLIVSNCVVNLSPNKHKVLKEMTRVLKTGGEIYFSDVYASLRIPKELKETSMWGECLSGSLYWNDFKLMMKDLGLDVRIMSVKVVHKGKTKESLKELKGDALKRMEKVDPIFYSITVRAFKVPTYLLERTEEDYGETVTFKGDKYSDSFVYDINNIFMKGEATSVSSNTYETLKQSKYAKFFEFSKRGIHLGRFKTRKTEENILDDAEKNYSPKDGFSSIKGGGCSSGTCETKQQCCSGSSCDEC